MGLEKDIQKNKLLLLGKLFATLTHEIRNPLSVLKINLELLEVPETEEEKNEFLESISTSKEAVSRIETLVAQTIDFLRSGDDEQTNVFLNEVSENAYRFLSHRAQKEEIKFYTEYEEDVPAVFANKNEILQIVINLVNNAMDAVEKGGFVKIKTYSEGEEVVLEVEDNGIGIKEEKQSKVFDAYFTTKKKGTGLGLSVCNEIARKYNAKLDFSSKYGVGTRFFVRFRNNGEVGYDS